MYGYVVVNKPELKFREFDVYRSYYCGLCRSLGEAYGIAGKFSISYDDDHHKAMDIIRNIIAEEDKVEHSPDEPMIAVCEHGANAVVIITRFWIPTENYWEIRFRILERVKEEFDKNGITIPYKQLDIHNVHTNDNS